LFNLHTHSIIIYREIIFHETISPYAYNLLHLTFDGCFMLLHPLMILLFFPYVSDSATELKRTPDTLERYTFELERSLAQLERSTPTLEPLTNTL
jgi:hypothetical protein